MFDLLKEESSPKIVEPPLISMIAIFSMLILFLIAGTVFGTSSIEVPTHYNLAESKSKEDLVAAAQLHFIQGGVKLSFSPNTYPFHVFHDAYKKSPERVRLSQVIREYLAKIPKSEGEGGRILYVVAERTATYKTIFDVIRVMRLEGFESMMFVSRVKGES